MNLDRRFCFVLSAWCQEGGIGFRRASLGVGGILDGGLHVGVAWWTVGNDGLVVVVGLGMLEMLP